LQALIIKSELAIIKMQASFIKTKLAFIVYNRRKTTLPVTKNMFVGNEEKLFY